MTFFKNKKEYYEYIAGAFNHFAPFYDGFVNFISGGEISKIREKVVEISGAEDISKILDICCGTGGQTFAFGKIGYEVVGIDFSEGMLEIAKRKNKYKNMRFLLADARHIPFEDNYFDISCISFGLHDMPHYVREEVLDELKRVSKRIVIVDYNIPENKLHRWLHVFLISLYESKYFKDFARQNLKELLQQHGLKVIKETYGMIDFVKILVCEKINSERRIGDHEIMRKLWSAA
ncbi:MAG: class I SAM-dependent methyltransferase [bacterium]